MISLMKKGAIILLAFFAFNTANAQLGTKILSIDSIAQLEPIIMFDTTNFAVHVTVDDTSFFNNDTIIGDLFYYYQTDSMDTAGVAPRVINNDLASETINGFIIDTVSIDIQPDEIRTSPPVNLIILWPAMVTLDPQIVDSENVSINVIFEGYLNIPKLPDKDKHKILFPVPAMQYLYINTTEIELLQQVHLTTIDGKMIRTYEHDELRSGFINIDELPSGTYMVELIYKNGSTIRTKVIKNQ